MDEDSKSHMERRMNSYMQSREDQVFHRRTRFALDMDGNMIFDDDGCVTKTKKFFMQTAEYYKVDGEEITLCNQVNYTEESDHLTVLYSKVEISDSPVQDIYNFFSQAGKIKTIKIVKDEIQKKLSAEIEFECFKSLAVAMAIAVKNKYMNVCTKESIHVGSFPLEEIEVSEGGDMSIKDVFNQKIYIGFSHIPMTVDWLKKIFEVFGVVQKLMIPRPHKLSHLGYAILQFDSAEGVRAALRLDKQLEFIYQNVTVEMQVTALDGTELSHDGETYTTCKDPVEDDGSL